MTKVVVIGGSGLIGSKLVHKLKQHGHEAVAASRSTGVDTVTGAGLIEVLRDTDTVIDVSNAPSSGDGPAWDFFTTSTGNLLTAEEAVGVRHHVLLSMVGAGRLPTSGYFRAKAMQEQLVRESAVGHSIVRSTQVFESVAQIAGTALDETIRISPALTQPIAAIDLATFVGQTAIGRPSYGVHEIAGPDRYAMDQLVRMQLSAVGDPRQVVADPRARYFGAVLEEPSLLPNRRAKLSSTNFTGWLADNTSVAVR
ncbi:NmrA family transcriptional regulator [Mycolicibacterium peregrinum]|uniref:NmrA family transcriptional regulator n=1 Tax=Mycolicibacterium peregrinum TaxID=43304 RepID=A0A1A0QQ32_MYCPR|nr:SDR family oxidoreductase [Mycolicibacterium peregrinum]OBB24261.1 NmrA family transcriptional regulator [Mycolicibacterium peregrinum]